MQQLLAQLWHSFLFKFYRIASLRTVALKWSSRNIFISTSFLQCYAHLSKSPLGPKVDRASFPKAERRELLVQLGFLSIHFVIPTCTLASAPGEEVKAPPVCPWFQLPCRAGLGCQPPPFPDTHRAEIQASWALSAWPVVAQPSPGTSHMKNNGKTIFIGHIYWNIFLLTGNILSSLDKFSICIWTYRFVSWSWTLQVSLPVAEVWVYSSYTRSYIALIPESLHHYLYSPHLRNFDLFQTYNFLSDLAESGSEG